MTERDKALFDLKAESRVNKGKQVNDFLLFFP